MQEARDIPAFLRLMVVGSFASVCRSVSAVVFLAAIGACAGGASRRPRAVAAARMAPAASVVSTSRGARTSSPGGPEPSVLPGAATRRPHEGDGCDPARAVPASLRPDARPLDALTSDGPTLPQTEWAHGPLRFSLPSAWFPVRDDGDAHAVYLLRTGDRSDAAGLYVGAVPPARSPRGESFTLAQGGVIIRGVVRSTGPTLGIDALATLPCGRPRFAYLWADVSNREQLVRLVAMVRSIRVVAGASTFPAPVEVDATRDAPALAAMTADDPLARQLVERGSRGDGLRAIYPLTTVHPLADQTLLGRFRAEFQGVPETVWVHVPVVQGRARAPAAYGALFDGSLATTFAGMRAAGCRMREVRFAHDAVTVRCEGEDAASVGISDDTVAGAFRMALDRFVTVRLALARWSRDPGQVGGWPDALCPSGARRIVVDGSSVFVSSEHCVVALDPVARRVVGLASDGDCAAIPDLPWATRLRTTGRFDEVRGAGRTYCHYTFGWRAGAGWLIASGDGGTASGPVARGPTMGVDPRSVNTAVAFVHDLAAYVTEQSSEAPANVQPEVLRSLGADRPGSLAAAPLLRAFLARGGLSGPGATAVLGARALDAERVEVALLPLTVVLTRRGANWLVTSASVIAFDRSSRPH